MTESELMPVLDELELEMDRECPVCGGDVPSVATFCPWCGHDFDGNGDTDDVFVAERVPMTMADDGEAVSDADPTAQDADGGEAVRKGPLEAVRELAMRLLPRRGRKAPAITLRHRPDSTQQLVNFEQMYPDGIARLAPSTYSAALSFEDTSYASARRDEQDGIIDRYVAWLNSLGDDVSCQLWLYTRQIGQRDLDERLLMQDVLGDDVANRYRHEFNALVRAKAVAGRTKAMREYRVVVLTIEAATHEAAAKRLDPLVETAHTFFSSLDVRSRMLTGEERLDLINLLTNQDDLPGYASFENEDPATGITTLDLVAPAVVDRLPGADLRVSDRCVRTYVIQSYGSATTDALLPQLLRLPCDTAVSMHFRAWNQLDALKAADDDVFATELENNQYIAARSNPKLGKFFGKEDLPDHLVEANDAARRVRAELKRRQQSYFGLVTTIQLQAADQDSLEQAHDALKNVAEACGIRVEHRYAENRMQAFAMTLPCGNPAHVKPNPRRMLRYNRNLLTDNLANMVPFHAVNMLDENGMFMGINRDTRDFILYDWDAHDTPNAFSLGMPRGGKSAGSKSIIMQARLRYPDDDIVWIDPENESPALAKAMGALVVNMSEASEDHINLFDLSEYYSNDAEGTASTNPLPMKVSFLKSAIHMMAGHVSDEEWNVIDQACGQVYQEYLADFDPEKTPTLQDFYDYLLSVEGSEAEDAHHLAKLIWSHVEGTLSVFNHKTNVDLDNHFVVFNLKDLSTQLKPIAMLVILDHIWNRVTKNREAGRRTRVFIDELQLLLDDEYALNFFDMLWTRSGKWGCLLMGITQNVTRLLDMDRTRYMVENSHLLILYKQAPVVARELADILSLSESQRRALELAEPGEGLYVFDSNKVISFDNRIPRSECPAMYHAITTRFTDIATYQQQVEGA